MALSGTRLGDAIVSAIQSVTPPSPADSGTAYLRAYWEAIAAAIVAEITNHAQVAVASVSGVQSGGSNSGPGTGSVS